MEVKSLAGYVCRNISVSFAVVSVFGYSDFSPVTNLQVYGGMPCLTCVCVCVHLLDNNVSETCMLFDMLMLKHKQILTLKDKH